MTPMENTPYQPGNYEQAMPTSPSSFKLVSEVFFAPRKAMQLLTIDFPVMMPLLLVVLSAAGLFAFYYSNVDFNWLIDHLTEVSAKGLSKSERTNIHNVMSQLTPGNMALIAGISVTVFIVISFVVQSGMLVLVSSVTNDGFQFKQWFSLVGWSHLPSLVTSLASAMTILISENGQIAPESINPLSLNELIFHLDPTHGWGKIFTTIDLSYFWTIALMSIGYTVWTKSHWLKGLLIVILANSPMIAIGLIFA